jgi:hypothetical protein
MQSLNSVYCILLEQTYKENPYSGREGRKGDGEGGRKSDE